MNTKLQAVRKTRAIAVQLNREVIDHLDGLAQRSSMSRHRYMILLLRRAIRTDLVIKEEAIFSSGNI
jgi:predicted transcriptional regulator